MGPKKKFNANVFGYVDLLTKKDYELLLSFDGTEYRGRAIRVDHATRKKTFSKSSRSKKAKTREKDSSLSSTMKLHNSKSYNRQPRLKKVDVHTKKTSCRFQRFKPLRSRKTGTRKRQTYKKEQKSSGTKK